MLRIVEAVDALLPGVPPLPPYMAGTSFLPYTRYGIFFRYCSKRCHRRTRLILPVGGNAPSGLPPAMPFGMVRGAAPPKKGDHALSRNVSFFLPRRRPSSDLASHRHCYSASVIVLPTGGFILGATRPQTPRQGASPLHPL